MSPLGTLAILSTLMLIASTSAASLTYKAACTGAAVVLPVITKATGSVSITLINQTYASGYFYATNINQMTKAHLHAGAVGSNGPVIAWAFNGTYGPISGSIKATFTFNPSVNNISVLLAAGLVYFNIHTIAYPAGELRGQLLSTPAPLLGIVPSTNFSVSYISLLPPYAPGAIIASSVPVGCSDLILSSVVVYTGTVTKAELATSFPSISSPATNLSAAWISAFIVAYPEVKMVMTQLTLSSAGVLQAYDSEARSYYGCSKPCYLDSPSVNQMWSKGTPLSLATSTSSNGYGVSSLQIMANGTVVSPPSPPPPSPPPPPPAYAVCPGTCQAISCAFYSQVDGSCITGSCCGGYSNSTVIGIRCLTPSNSLPYRNGDCSAPFPPSPPPTPPSPPPSPPLSPHPPSPPPPEGCKTPKDKCFNTKCDFSCCPDYNRVTCFSDQTTSYYTCVPQPQTSCY